MANPFDLNQYNTGFVRVQFVKPNAFNFANFDEAFSKIVNAIRIRQTAIEIAYKVPRSEFVNVEEYGISTPQEVASGVSKFQAAVRQMVSGEILSKYGTLPNCPNIQTGFFYRTSESNNGLPLTGLSSVLGKSDFEQIINTENFDNPVSFSQKVFAALNEIIFALNNMRNMHSPMYVGYPLKDDCEPSFNLELYIIMRGTAGMNSGNLTDQGAANPTNDNNWWDRREIGVRAIKYMLKALRNNAPNDDTVNASVTIGYIQDSNSDNQAELIIIERNSTNYADLMAAADLLYSDSNLTSASLPTFFSSSATPHLFDSWAEMIVDQSNNRVGSLLSGIKQKLVWIDHTGCGDGTLPQDDENLSNANRELLRTSFQSNAQEPNAIIISTDSIIGGSVLTWKELMELNTCDNIEYGWSCLGGNVFVGGYNFDTEIDSSEAIQIIQDFAINTSIEPFN